MQRTDLFQTNLASQEQYHATADALRLGSRPGQVIHIHYKLKIIFPPSSKSKRETEDCKIIKLCEAVGRRLHTHGT